MNLNRFTKVCIQCQKEFKTSTQDKDHCSANCLRLYRISQRDPATFKTTVCEQCGGSFSFPYGNRKFCTISCREEYYKKKYEEDAATSKFRIFERDNFQCVYCGDSSLDGKKLVVDHVYPRASGGGNELFNLVTSCVDCNLAKTNRHFTEEMTLRLWNRNQQLNEQRGLMKDYDVLKGYFEKAYKAT